MFDIATAMDLACFAVEARAQAEGRVATEEEYRTKMQETWDIWLNASVARDMTRVGFIQTERGWQKPRRWWEFWRR